MVRQVYGINRTQNEALMELVGVRVVVLRAGTFVDLLKSVEATLGDEASAFFYEAGIRAGRGSAKVLLEVWEERGMDFLERWGEFYGSNGVGWFKLESVDIDFAGGNGYIRVRQSFIAGGYDKSDKPVCHFLCGQLVGLLQEVLGEKLMCEEVKCAATGDPYCEFQFEKYS